MLEAVSWALKIAGDHLALVSILAGTAAGYAAGLIGETYFIPESYPKRRQQAITVVVTLAVSWALTTATWGALVGSTPFKVRALVSISAALLAPFTYPYIGRFMTKRFPSVGSIWSQAK